MEVLPDICSNTDQFLIRMLQYVINLVNPKCSGFPESGTLWDQNLQKRWDVEKEDFTRLYFVHMQNTLQKKPL